MRNVVYFKSLAWGMMFLGLVACSRSGQEQFVVKGQLDTGGDTVLVMLVDTEGKYSKLDSCFVTGGVFVLQGQVSSPTMCELQFQQRRGHGFATYVSSDLLLENTAYTVTMPSWAELGKITNQQARMKTVCVEGGKAQRGLLDYQKTIAPIDSVLHPLYAHSLFISFGLYDADTAQLITAQINALEKQKEEAMLAFVRSHPKEPLAAYFVQQELSRPFKYTAREQKDFVALLQENADTGRVNRLERDLSRMLQYSRLQPYADFAVFSSEGQQADMSSLLEEGKYVLWDFWASWCGPCRMAIPHVRELYEEYKDDLQVISVSVDKKEADWKQALEEEKMAWSQYRVDDKGLMQLAKAYRLTSIPYLVLLNPQGKILCATNDAYIASEYLEKQLNEL